MKRFGANGINRGLTSDSPMYRELVSTGLCR